MSQLYLPICPICQAPDSLAPETLNKEGQTFQWYACAECGSVLLSQPDGRWSYQKVGREDKAYLLKQPLTLAELQALVEVPPEPLAQTELIGQPVPAETLAAFPDPEPPAAPRLAEQPIPAEAYAAPPPPPPVPEKKKKGLSIWVVLAVVAVGLCLCCGVSGLLTWRFLGDQAADIATSVMDAGLVIATPVAKTGQAEATPVSEGGQSGATPGAAAPQDTPVPAGSPAPTDAPPSEPAAPAPGSDLDTASLTTPANLSSYRSSMRIVITEIVDGQEQTDTIEMEVAYTSDPLAQHVSVTGVGIDETGGMNSVEWYLVGDTMYMDLGAGDWMSMPATEGEDLAAGLVTPDALLDDTCGWQSQGATTLDGIQVERWTVTKAQMEACMLAEQFTAVGNLTDAGGEMFVALDGSYVAQMDFFYAGTNLDLGMTATDQQVAEGRFEFSYKLTDVNQPFSIDLPEGAQETAAGPDDIPIPENAQGVSNMGGLITFTSPDTPAQLADYYKAQMPGLGWSEVSTEDMGGMIILEFTKEAKTTSIMLQPGDAGLSTVLITVE